MEEKHTVVDCGAGTSIKIVLHSKEDDPTHKHVCERCEKDKPIKDYTDDVDKMFIDRRNPLFSFYL